MSTFQMKRASEVGPGDGIGTPAIALRVVKKAKPDSHDIDAAASSESKEPNINRKKMNTKTPRPHTVSVALPGSVASHPNRELRTFVCGQLARVCSIFCVDEIIVYDDKLKAESRSWDPSVYFARILQYAETPTYLRRQLIPQNSDLQFAGLLPPLDAPHHLRQLDMSPFREGITLEKPPGTRPGGLGAGSFVECTPMGFCPLRGVKDTPPPPPPFTRTTRTHLLAVLLGRAVPPSTPREELGLYWGYQTRLASSLGAVFSESPFETYDYKIGVSSKAKLSVPGTAGKKFVIPPFKHLLIVLEGTEGLEECVENDQDLAMSGVDTAKLFDAFVRTCPSDGSRSIRTEESLAISLTKLAPFIDKANAAKAAA
jgi:predicted SPOUT superfamily RNA methylase MTH1